MSEGVDGNDGTLGGGLLDVQQWMAELFTICMQEVYRACGTRKESTHAKPYTGPLLTLGAVIPVPQ